MKKLENKEKLKIFNKIQFWWNWMKKWKNENYTIEILACSDTLREVLRRTLFLRASKRCTFINMNVLIFCTDST